MAGEGGKSIDFYSVMGLKKECSEAELRNAYKKLALRWHPDRCSASGNLKYVEEAKKKFQAIQQAYSVLSDTNKRFLYDVGVYDCDDDDDENGMGDFLNEMAAMMGQNKSNENGGKGSSFEELKELFVDMFESDMEMDMNASTFDYSSSSSNKKKNTTTTTTTCFSAGSYNNGHDNNNNNKRASSEKSSQHSSSSSPAVLSFDANFNGFCFGAEQVESIGGGSSNAANRKKRTNGGGGGGRKHKISTDHNDVSDYYYYHYDNGGGGGGISAA